METGKFVEGEGVLLHKTAGDEFYRLSIERGAGDWWNIIFSSYSRNLQTMSGHLKGTFPSLYTAQEKVVSVESLKRQAGWHNVGMCGLCESKPVEEIIAERAKKGQNVLSGEAKKADEEFGFWEKGKSAVDRLNEFKKNVEARVAKEAKDRVTRLAELKAKLIDKSPSQQSSLFGLGDDDFDEEKANELAETIKASAKELEAAITANTNTIPNDGIYGHTISFGDIKASDVGKLLARTRPAEPKPEPKPEPPVGGRSRKFKCEDY